MSIKQLDHLNLTVASLSNTVDWYQRVFGFRVVEEGVGDYGPWQIIRSGDAMLCLYERANRMPADRDGYDDSPVHRVNHIGLRITDRRAWLDSIDQHQLQLDYDGAVSWPNSTSWYLKDPNGYQLEVVLWRSEQIHFDTEAA